VKAADETGESSLGTAAMIAYYWLQREEDIIGRLSWGHYRPADAPDVARIFHHKTGELVDIPLFDEDRTLLWPELMERLDTAPRYGTLIVTRERVDRRRKVHLPWKEDHFRHRFAEIREAAGIDFSVKFMGLRHGGSTESGNAELTDTQIRALSGHTTAAMTALYTKTTMRQRKTLRPPCGSARQEPGSGLKKEQKEGICRNKPLRFCRNEKLKTAKSLILWWAHKDSNLGPAD
jgi:Phage integrase family